MAIAQRSTKIPNNLLSCSCKECVCSFNYVIWSHTVVVNDAAAKYGNHMATKYGNHMATKYGNQMVTKYGNHTLPNMETRWLPNMVITRYQIWKPDGYQIHMETTYGCCTACAVLFKMLKINMDCPTGSHVIYCCPPVS